MPDPTAARPGPREVLARYQQAMLDKSADDLADLYAFDLIAASWRKSSASGAENNCVEIAELPGGGKAIRDSKNPKREPLRCTATEWAAFRDGVASGEL